MDAFHHLFLLCVTFFFSFYDLFQMSNQDSISNKDRKSESNYNHVRKLI
jgi:hypothetical protein